jgi:hypothetical protein
MSIKSLNSYLYTNDDINEGIEYLRNNTLPDRLNNQSSKYRFKRRWRGFTVKNNKLFYGPLLVIPSDRVKETIKKFYEDPAFGGSIGRDKLYNKIIQTYLGIKKN